MEGGKENESTPKFKFINKEKTDTDKTYIKEAIELIKKSKNVTKENKINTKSLLIYFVYI